MVIDYIKNAGLYKNLSENFKIAFDALEKLDLGAVAKGERYELKGEDVYFSLQTVDGKEPDDEMYEAHKKYADIQYITRGTEFIGWANTNTLELREEYRDDIMFYRGKGQLLRFDEGMFCILFPEDAHMPCRNDGVSPCQSDKIVVKVRL